MSKVVTISDPYVRIVRDTANSTLDYHLPLSRVKDLALPEIHCYASERTWYDPDGNHVSERVNVHAIAPRGRRRCKA